MELSLGGGEVAVKRASSATGEDRISALPDELLIIILLFVDNAAVAARTSVLSRRWRSVWMLLLDLRVPFLPEPLSFRRALTTSQLRLHYLVLEGDRATVESLAIWLPAAVRRLSGGTLVLVNHAPDPEGMPATSRVLKREEKERFFEMPSFENAAKILLELGFMRTFMPFASVFAQLTVLHLERVWFDGSCLLSDAVSSSKSRWRCPCLQVLKIHNARGLSDLVINSESLLEVELSNLDSLWERRIEAAVLKILTVVNCFFFCFRATVSAPQLVFLEWSDLKGQCSVELGQMPHLRYIGELSYFVYGLQGPNGTPKSEQLSLYEALAAL